MKPLELVRRAGGGGGLGGCKRGENQEDRDAIHVVAGDPLEIREPNHWVLFNFLLAA